MNRSRLLWSVLVILALSLLLNIGTVMHIDAMRTSQMSLEQSYMTLSQDYAGLNQSYLELNWTCSDLGRSFDAMHDTYVSLFFSPVAFSPPVTMLEATRIAMTIDGWNEASLRNMVVFVSLRYGLFGADGSSGPGHEVTAPVSDYSPVTVDDGVYRYFWWIVMQRNDGERSIPPPGYYYIDAATGENMTPTGLL
jgi:hypothetical protein